MNNYIDKHTGEKVSASLIDNLYVIATSSFSPGIDNLNIKIHKIYFEGCFNLV